jgi:hypothetical protein
VKFLSLMTYLGFVWALFVSLCLAPGESLGQTATQYSRVVAQAERIAYLAAQRSALASQVATAALAPSAASMAVRMVAGPVGWAALGVSAGLVLAQMYYSQADLSAVKTAASTPGGWQVASTNAGVQTFPGFGHQHTSQSSLSQRDHSIQRDQCPAVCGGYEYQHDWVVGPFQSLSTAVFFTGNFFVNGPAVGGYSLYVCHRTGIPGLRRLYKMA